MVEKKPFLLRTFMQTPGTDQSANTCCMISARVSNRLASFAFTLPKAGQTACMPELVCALVSKHRTMTLTAKPVHVIFLHATIED